ncbi:MAG: FAD/NAD(P)-binding protein [Lactobacillaceae bacterium]|jgi:uncharacterized NAD(P)/FAD-binding protein YdhS|nr:FAD/NAD(P)-binding protein [Lactobacillaceae bacterium]
MKIVLVGAGPRNLALLPRIISHAKKNNEQVSLNIFDSQPIGGRVWRPNQDPLFLMNTVTSQLTLFSDASIETTAPLTTGPSFFEWTQGPSIEYIKAHDYSNQAAFLDEIARINPDRFASRALFGVYAQWFYDQVVATLPDNVELTFQQTAVVDVLQQENGTQLVKLADGTDMPADHVVLALGHADQVETGEASTLRTFATQNELTYLPVSHPAEAVLDSLVAKEPVIMRGLGLSFFDYIAKLSLGRGGKFERAEDTGLIYIPSGQEPKIIAGSRSGIPMHARGVNQKDGGQSYQPKFFTNENLDKAAIEQNGQVTFDFFFGLLKKEMAYKHYLNTISDLAVSWPFNADEFLHALEQADDLNVTARNWGIPEQYIMDWDRIFKPIPVVSDIAAYNQEMVDYLNWDIHDARQGNDDAPYAGAFDLLRDVRGVIRHYLQAGYLNADEYEKFLKTFNPFNSIISVGPPALRIEQMRALIKAGILTVLGPGLKVTMEDQHFIVTDNLNTRMKADQLVEARLYGTNVATSANPLIANLFTRGVLSDATYTKSDGSTYTIGGARMNQTNLTVIDAQGNEVPGLHIWGVPTEGWSWFTTSAPRPNNRDKALRDAEHIAENIFN